MSGSEDHAVAEARLLASTLGLDADLVAKDIAPREDLVRWAASGGMHLTGTAEGPPCAPPSPVASRLEGAAAVLSHLGGFNVDGPALLGERAALRGLSRRGAVSAGGGSRLLPSADGWVAVTLSRPDDWELVPALLSGAGQDWDAVTAVAAATAGAAFATRGQELGLAIGVVTAEQDEQTAGRSATPWVLSRRDGSGCTEPLRVVDLSALWAGPLCADLLALAGATVVKVESPDRPDGARVGDPALFSLLHRGSQVLDLRGPELRSLIDGADVVITSSRPRAIEQLGLMDALTGRPGLTWVAITGYGLTGPWRNRIAYGDDAAAAGGLVAYSDGPVFCADAAADPATGLYAAIAALACAQSGGGLIDIALRDVARHLARPPLRAEAPALVSTTGGWQVETPEGRALVATPRARTR
jgi:hypothetical protein